VKALNVIIATCLILALLRYAIIFLLIAACVLMLWALLHCPRAVLGFLLLGLATDTLRYHPYIALGLIAVAVLVSKDQS
jgi:hypothetical protein